MADTNGSKTGVLGTVSSAGNVITGWIDKVGFPIVIAMAMLLYFGYKDLTFTQEQSRQFALQVQMTRDLAELQDRFSTSTNAGISRADTERRAILDALAKLDAKLDAVGRR